MRPSGVQDKHTEDFDNEGGQDGQQQTGRRHKRFGQTGADPDITTAYAGTYI